MLSKLLRAPDQKEVLPYSWRPSAGALVREHSLQTSAAQGERKPVVVLSEAQSLLLKTRMGELETTAVKRNKEARDAAYTEGERAARDQDAAAVRAVVEKLGQSILDLAGMRAKLRGQAEVDVVRLAFAIAKRVIHRELSTDPDSIVGLVKVALEKLRLQETVRVRMHPDHVKIVKEFLSHSAGTAHIEVTGDAAIGLGGVVFETTRGEFDVSTDVQLNEIEKGLTDRIAG
jgi:flagellar assembly protein FliH